MYNAEYQLFIQEENALEINPLNQIEDIYLVQPRDRALIWKENQDNYK